MIKKEEVYKIGLFNKPHGIHGELQFTFTDDIFDRVDCDYLICLLDGIFVPFFIEEYRFRSDSTALVKLEGIDTAERARMFTNIEVYFPVKHAEEADDNYARKIDTYTKIETNREIQNAKPKKLKWGIEVNGGYLNNAGDPQGEFNFGYDKDALYLNPKKILESITYSLAKDDYLLVSHAQLTQALKEYKAVKKISGLNPDSIGNVNLDGKYLSKTDPSVVKFGNIGDLEFKKGAVRPNGLVGQFETLYYKNDGNTTFLANVDMLNAVSATKVNKSTLSEELDKKADKTDLDKKMDLKLIRIDSSNAEKYGLNRDLIYKAAKEGRYDFASTVISEPLRLPEEVKSVPFYLQITNFNTFQEQVIVASNNFVPTIYRRFIENNTANKRTWYKFTGIPVEK